MGEFKRILTKKPVFKISDPSQPPVRYTMPDYRETVKPIDLGKPPEDQIVTPEQSKVMFEKIKQRVAGNKVQPGSMEQQNLQQRVDAANPPERKHENLVKYFSEAQDEEDALDRFGDVKDAGEVDMETLEDAYDEYLRRRGYSEEQIQSTYDIGTRNDD